MKKFFSKTKKIVLAHKIIAVVCIIVFLGFGYYVYGKLTSTTGETKYITTLVKKGTIISTVTGSGQVFATNQIDVKAKVSGDITWVSAKAGQVVYAGQALAGIDSKDAKNAVDEAEASLVQSKLQFQKDSASAPIDYQKTIDNLATAKEDLKTTFNDSFNTISNTYLNLPTVMTGMQNVLYGYDFTTAGGTWNVDYINNIFKNNEDNIAKISPLSLVAINDYISARAKYDVSFSAYKKIGRNSSDVDIEKFLDQSIDTTISIAQALQSELNFLGSVVDVAQIYSIKLPSNLTTMQTSVRSYLSTVNSDLSGLLSQKKSITSARQSIKNYEDTITLLKVGNDTGSNPISLQIAKNNLIKQERDLENLKTNLSYYTVVAPFAGTIASVSAKVGESAGTIATLITNQQVAELSLNEIDATKIKMGQKATLTFDAIDDFSLTGTVSEIDPMGTVSQGVVSYTVKITFDTQDKRIKAGMTINASVQTDVRQDVLYVPSSAVKTNNGESYVLAFDPPLADTSSSSSGVASLISPTQIPVRVGISDDTSIEILSGLKEGQQIVSRTTIGTTVAKTTNSPSLFGGGGTRAIGR